MLSRVADSIFWIGRYVERAENTARLLDVALRSTRELSSFRIGADRSETDSTSDLRLVLTALGAEALYEQRVGAVTEDGLAMFLVVDRDNPLSAVSCLTVARDNARGVRETISTEMWEELNRTYLSLQRVTTAYLLIEGLHDFCRQIRLGCQLFHGVTDATMPQDEAWRFLQVGKHLERAGMTARILAARSREFDVPDERPRAEEVHRWLGLLRSISAYEAYMRLSPGGVYPAGVASFLLLSQVFPRSVAFSCRRVNEELEAIDRELGRARTDGPSMSAGGLASRLRYTKIEALRGEAMLPFLRWVEQQCNAVGDELRSIYFESSWLERPAAVV
ncbi:MAG TPA: alpha-E domain-containing protein [Dehalococcoidia bacterium]|nr:alpha-E domain-containing protein [Dehalococcoidia bacterium]